jgi:asparagine synthase (glutamine-hydrolysing)
MTFSIEARNPFLDYRVVETGLGLAVADLLHHGITKWSLREAMRDVLPPEVVNRAAKQGFTSDEKLWFRGALGDELLRTFRAPSFGTRGYFDVSRVLALLEEHRAGADHAWELWRAFSVERWFRVFIDPATVIPPTRVANAPRAMRLDDSKIVRLRSGRGRAYVQ